MKRKGIHNSQALQTLATLHIPLHIFSSPNFVSLCIWRFFFFGRLVSRCNIIFCNNNVILSICEIQTPMKTNQLDVHNLFLWWVKFWLMSYGDSLQMPCSFEHRSSSSTMFLWTSCQSPEFLWTPRRILQVPLNFEPNPPSSFELWVDILQVPLNFEPNPPSSFEL